MVAAGNRRVVSKTSTHKQKMPEVLPLASSVFCYKGRDMPRTMQPRHFFTGSAWVKLCMYLRIQEGPSLVPLVRHDTTEAYLLAFQLSQAFCTACPTCAGLFLPRPISCKPILTALLTSPASTPSTTGVIVLYFS